jgi:uncharacterized RDD family membrane protein YckC
VVENATVTDAGYEIICNDCRASVPSNAETCPECGTVLLGQPSPPPATGTPASAESNVRSSAPDSSPTSRWNPVVDTAILRGPIRTVWFAGFWIRVVSWLVDYLIGVMAVAVARVALGPVGLLLFLPLWLFYGPIMESSAWQGTVGKRVCGLAVTDTHGERITFGRAVVRLLAKVLSLMALGIGFLMIAFQPRKRGLHDILAGTLVVHG